MSHLPWVKLALGLIILCLINRPGLVYGVETYTSGQLLLSDNFNDGNYQGWKVQSGQWVVDSGKQLAAVVGGTLLSGRIAPDNTGWDNYKIEFDIKNDSGINEGFGFRRLDNNNYYEVTFRHAVRGVIGFNGAPEIIIKKTQNGTTSTLLDTHSVTLVTGVFYHIKLEAVLEHLQLWVDNSLVLDLDDKGTSVKSGGMFFSYNVESYGITSARFDNVVVTALNVPKPIYPVIFIPGIGGSALKTSQDTIWNKDDGHGGVWNFGYKTDEQVWVNQDQAVKPGEDDYFDVLKLKADGVTSEAPIVTTGNLVPFGYADLDNFFSGMGYSKNQNYFVFPYDWRKDIKETQPALDSLIEQAKKNSGLSKVNIVAHSMGGLIARYYIADKDRAAKVNKLIELGVPHLGAVNSIKGLIYGYQIGPSYLFGLIGLNSFEARDVLQNYASNFQLMPTAYYYNFYEPPFKDDRDIDGNGVTGLLNFSEFRNLLAGMKYNMTAFGFGEQLHNFLDPLLDQFNNVKVYEIVGSSQPTLGQIIETWWMTWPMKILPKTEEVYINGDETVPLYSASLKSPGKDLSGGAAIYYVDQTHSDLPRGSGPAMQTVKAILLEDTLPVEVKSEKISLEGQQLSVDDDVNLDLYDESGNHTGINSNGDIETNIPGTFFNSTGQSKHIFVKKSAKKTTAKITAPKSTKTNMKVRRYSNDTVTGTSFYGNVGVGSSLPVQITVDPVSGNIGGLDPTGEASGSAALDQAPAKTTISIQGDKGDLGYTGSVTITFIADDGSGSGVGSIYYSLDNGQTVNLYSKPFTISAIGTTTIQYYSVDKLGNAEIPKSLVVTIVASIVTLEGVSPIGSSSPDPIVPTGLQNDNTVNTRIASSGSTSLTTVRNDVVGFPVKDMPEEISQAVGDQKTLENVLGTKNEAVQNQNSPFLDSRFRSMVMVSELLGGLLAVWLGVTLLMPPPK